MEKAKFAGQQCVSYEENGVEVQGYVLKRHIVGEAWEYDVTWGNMGTYHKKEEELQPSDYDAFKKFTRP